MTLIPMLVRASSSTPSLVSQITFYEDDDDLSQEISSTSFTCNNKWYAEKELCHFRAVSDFNYNLSERLSSSSEPIPMPERKGSTNGLHGLPNKRETKYETLKNVFLNSRSSSKQQQGSQPPLAQGPKGRMANAKWDLGRNGTSGPSSLSGKRRLSFRRITMAGSTQGSMGLRKPTRRVSKGRRERETTDMIRSGHSPTDSKNHFLVPPPQRACHLSTMPLAMPTRKPSTQDMLSVSPSGSTNALRKKLSRSKLHNTGALNPMVATRLVGSPSSVKRNQSRDLLWRYG